MPISQESFNNSLFDLLKTRGYRPTPIDSKGNSTQIPEEADVFRFDFIKDDTNYGDVWITIDESKNLVIYYNDEVADSPSTNTSGTEFSNSWSALLKHLKNWAQRRQLGFDLKNRDHLATDMAKREHMKKKEQLGEGYYPMGKKASYNDSVPQVKIILQHTRQIEEGEQRFRNIAKIFVENVNGERFLVPTIRPGIARVYARHVAEGGTPYDERGKHITSLVEEYTKMAGFVRATRNGQFNESAQRLVNEATNHYQSLRETLSRMTGHRGYNQYFESYTPVLNEETDDETSLNELFVQETLDPRIENVMPILKRLNKNISEMSEVKALEEWATSLTEVEDETTKTLAEPAEKMLEGLDKLKDSLNNAVMRRIMSQHPKLLKDLDNLEMAIDDAVSWFVGDGVEEVGSSDISAIVKDVAQRMEERHADIDEASELSKGGHKYSEKPYVCVHAKKGKFKCHADTSYEAAKKAAQKWGLKSTAGIDVHLADVEHTAVNEAPGAETLAHNQSTEKSNLKAFDLDEDDMEEGIKDITKKVGKKFRQSAIGRAREHGYSIEEGFSPSEEVADQIIDSLGGEDGLTSDDIYRAVEEYQTMMDSPHKLDTDEVVQIVMNRMNMTELEEDLDANQKRAGQLGPTEKVGKNEKNLRGKLVGASESAESTEEAITEMDSPGPNDNPYAKGGKATPIQADKAKKDFAKILQKNIDKSNKAKHDTDKKVAQHQVKEGQDDLNAILRIIRK